MRYLKVAFGLMVVAGLMAVMVVPATAEEFRSVACESKAGGKWSNANCTTPSGSGSFETKEAASGKELTISTVPGEFLELEDHKLGIAVKCQIGGKDKVLTLGTAELVSASTTKCVLIKAGECEASKPVTVTTVHLPWNTKAEDVGGKLRNALKNSGVGEPGLLVECTIASIIRIADECDGETSTSLARRTAASGSEGSEEGAFDSNSPAFNCTAGGAGAGTLKGSILLRLIGASYVAWWILGLLGKE